MIKREFVWLMVLVSIIFLGSILENQISVTGQQTIKIKQESPRAQETHTRSKVTLNGILNLRHIDSEEPTFIYELTTANGELYSLIFETPPKFTKSQHITVTGEKYLSNLGNTIKVSSQDYILGPFYPPALESSNTGPQNTIVILAKKINQQPPYLPSVVEDIVFNDVNAFITENSYSQTWLTGDIIGWLDLPPEVLPRPSISKPPGICDPRDAIEVADPFVDFTQYDTIITVGPCEYTPSAYVGPTTVQTDEGLIYARYIVLPKKFLFDYATTAIVAHELGHGFGLGHANAYLCDLPFGEVGPDSQHCTNIDYGDHFDTMGGAFRSEFSSPHYNAFFKKEIGWLSPTYLSPPFGNIFFISPQEINNDPANNENKLYIIPYKGSRTAVNINNFYNLEYRVPIGFDAIYDSSWPSVQRGVYIRYAQTKPQPPSFFSEPFTVASYFNTWLIDAHPQTPTFDDSALLEGESYYDLPNNFIITVISATENGAWINIS